jgi:hypothetical protein
MEVARLNIEDAIWKDERFQDLMIKTGSRHAAKGMVLELWTLAQEYWFPRRELIPLERIKKSGLQPVIDVGLAESREGGVYARGSEENFGWLFQRQEAGQKSAEAKKAKKDIEATTVERPLTTVERESTTANDSQPLTPSLPLSPSLFPAQSQSQLKAQTPSGVPEIKSPVGFFITKYVQAYQKRYGEKARPDLRGKVQGQIKRFVQETPTERAINLIEVFCQMDDPWFKTKAHDFGTFLENLSKIGLALDTGQQRPGVNWDELNLEGA